jgi:hypothetical protein
MVKLYSSGGAQDYEILSPAMNGDKWEKFKIAVRRLLKARKSNCLDFFEQHNFKLAEGTNFFGDEFYILYFEVSLEKYVEYEENSELKKIDFYELANTITELGYFVRFIIIKHCIDIESDIVSQPTPINSTQIVELALKDSQNLLYSSGPVSAVDRNHTALHGYMQNICDEANINYSTRPALTELFKLIKENHPKFNSEDNDISSANKLLRSLSSIVDTLNYIRNNESIAHPNEKILQEPEAILVINCARTLFHYLSIKINKNFG